MRKFILVALLSLLSPLSHAASESDFAYGYTLEVDGDGAIYSLPLPEEVYRGLTRADRGDLRIFNSRGVAVPHHIKRPEQRTEVAIADTALPLFPLYNDDTLASTPNGHQVHIVTNDKGAIIDINYGKPETNGARVIKGYLIDSSQLTQVPNALMVNWQDDMSDFVMSVKVEGSDDLTHWQTLVARTTLSNLHYGEHTLVQHRIDLPLRKQKYLRLTWNNNRNITLSGVGARFPAFLQEQDRQWSDFPVTDTDSENQYYYFDTRSVLPADRVNIVLPQPNTLIQVNLASAPTEKGPWYTRYYGLLYNLQFEGNELKTPDQVMSTTTHRYWRLQILSKEGQLEGKPQLRLGWVPETLYFIAQGEAPFTLAYGSARVGPMDTSLAQLLTLDKIQHQQQLIKAAQLGSRIELGNKDKLKPAHPPTDWKQIVLWLVLLAGVASLSYMAMRLYKQMDQARPSE
ncbi:MAG: DUF3999 family protein [Gammaproteobacteria bacterium]|nr:DUF3999 family protein [Gammaproteobacteria bacterium]